LMQCRTGFLPSDRESVREGVFTVRSSTTQQEGRGKVSVLSGGLKVVRHHSPSFEARCSSLDRRGEAKQQLWMRGGLARPLDVLEDKAMLCATRSDGR